MERIKKITDGDVTTILYKLDSVQTDEDMIEFFRKLNESGKIKIDSLSFVNTVDATRKDLNYSCGINDEMDSMIGRIDRNRISIIVTDALFGSIKINMFIYPSTYLLGVVMPSSEKKSIGKVEQAIRGAD